jgi:hypothetical protein
MVRPAVYSVAPTIHLVELLGVLLGRRQFLIGNHIDAISHVD